MKKVLGSPLLLTLITFACLGTGVAWVDMTTHLPEPKNLATSIHRIKAALRPAKPYHFPGGGRKLSGAYQFVALYGSPDAPALGALGEQSLPAAVERVKSLAAVYQPLSSLPIYPTFEIIATVAAAEPTDNGDYSREVDLHTLQPWVAAAQAAGIYVVLDLQPGRSDFLTQTKAYQSLLRAPNVGLALDPEWRLGSNQVPLEQIGTVDSSEVNAVSAWLADLTAQAHLPQKLFVLHQFRLDMIANRQNIDTTHPELVYVIQMDGQGSQPQKHDTWQAITGSAPGQMEFGWKNFYQKDTPVLDTAGTMQLTPHPWYVSYQ